MTKTEQSEDDQAKAAGGIKHSPDWFGRIDGWMWPLDWIKIVENDITKYAKDKPIRYAQVMRRLYD